MIKQFLIKLFNVSQAESQKFFLLFFHSFFLGIFISVYYTLANSVFIQYFDSSYLAAGYLLSGVAGYILTTLYSYLQKKYAPQKVFLVSLLFLLAIVVFIWSSTSFLGVKTASFLTFVMAIPFMAITSLESGGLAMKLLDLRQMKRLFGPITTGSTIASIIGYLSIPVLLTFSIFSNPYHLLIIAALGLAISIVFLLKIGQTFGDAQENKKKDDTHEVVGFRSYLSDKFFIFMALSVVLSGVASYFSDFIFLASLRSQDVLVSTPEGRANFLALAYGVMKIGELILSYSAGKMFGSYGMRIVISILPFMTGGLIFVAMILGFIGGEESLFLFIFILLNKSFDNLLRKSLNDPAYKLLYQSLPIKKQLDVQTKIGMVAQIAIIISGALLMLINLVFISDGKVNFNLFLITFLPILVLWIYISRKTFKYYRLQLRKLLADKELHKKRQKEIGKYGIEILLNSIATDGSEANPLAVLILTETNPQSLSPYIIDLLSSDDHSVLQNTLRNITTITPLDELHRKSIIESVLKLTSSDDTEIANLAEEVIGRLDKSKEIKYDKKLPPAIRKAKEDFVTLKKLTFEAENNNAIKILNLLRSKDKIVKKAAITLAIRNVNKPLKQQVLNLLIEEDYSRTAISEIKKLGDDVIDSLDHLIKEEANVKVILRIVELFTNIGSPKAMKSILYLSDYPDRKVWTAVIKSLKHCRYQSDNEGRSIIKSRIAATVSHILWINVAILDLRSEKSVLKIIQSLEIEREMYYEVLFDLLSMIYEWGLVDLIKRNFVGEENIFAIELIENFIGEDIKDLIVPLFEGIPVPQQMKRLWELSPQRRMPAYERLKDIVNKDFNRVDLWTKAKALDLLAKNTKGKLPQEILSCLFHQDELIWSTATKIVYDKLGDQGLEIIERANINKRFLRKLTRSTDGVPDIINERLKFIKRTPLFFGIPENELLKLAGIFNIRMVGTNVKVPLRDDKGDRLIIIVVQGKLTSVGGVGFPRKTIIIPGHNISKHEDHLIASKGGLILESNKTEYLNLLVDEDILAKAIVG